MLSFSFVFSSCAKEDALEDTVEMETVVKQRSVYNGPKNTKELTVLLQTSENRVITELNASTKQSLIDYTVFEDGILRGWSHKDDNLKVLDDTNILEVLSVIVRAEVVSVGQELSGSGGGTHCKNCYWERGSDGCCHVGGDGCYEADSK